MRIRVASLLLVPAMMLLLSTPSHAASGDSGKTTITRSYISRGGSYGVVLKNGSKKCGTSAYWGFDATTVAGKAMMAKLEAAFVAGKQVKIACNGTYRTTWNWISAVHVY